MKQSDTIPATAKDLFPNAYKDMLLYSGSAFDDPFPLPVPVRVLGKSQCHTIAMYVCRLPDGSKRIVSPNSLLPDTPEMREKATNVHRIYVGMVRAGRKDEAEKYQSFLMVERNKFYAIPTAERGLPDYSTEETGDE